MDDPLDLFAAKPARPAEGVSPCYVDVVVRQGQRAAGPFSYVVPEALARDIAPGQLVWVPFRTGRLPAVVVAVGVPAPPFETRAVERILSPQPVLTPAQLALGRWLAEYYQCGLAEALLAMLPPGLLHRSRTVVALTEAGRSRLLAGLSPLASQAILALREAGGEMEVAALARALHRRTVGEIVARLARNGWLTLSTRLEEPAARPHYEAFLVLSAPEEAISALRAQLAAGRRDSPAARILEALARAPAGTCERRGLLAEVKARPAVLEALEAEGLLRSEAEQRTLRLVASEEEVSSFLEKQARRAPQQAALLRKLAESGGVLDLAEAQADLQARLALLRRGWLREEHRPARVRLSVLPEVALARAAQMRRTAADERQAGLLQALEQAPERALPLAALYRAVPGAGRADVEALVVSGVAHLETRERRRDPLAGQEVPSEAPPALTERQGRVWREIYEAFGKSGERIFLLHGVSSSGKTEIYLRALGRALREGRQALVLVPEISLTPQTVRRFAARFPGKVAVLHSGLSTGERYDQWRRIRDGEVDVVIGPRSALFAPLPRLGLIVVDEEHDASYKQDDLPPRYHARETALALARITGSLVILGSATPAVESYLQAQRGRFRLLELPDRLHVREGPAGFRQVLADTSRPQVQIVDMREELRAGNTSLFSRPLQRALREVLAAGEQALLFLNRRGAATFVMCRECGFVVRCSRCEVPMVYHSAEERLLCHRCGRRAVSPARCPQCGSPKIRHFGAGTERVVAEVVRLLPTARVLRWDSDATRERGTHEEIMAALVEHRADVLVGTQMVAKGLDLPLVTLVGVVSADTALHLPDLRAAERTFQLLTQVIGRAGRREARGRAIIQTYSPEHYAIQAAARQDYGAFFRRELDYRRRYGYPPFAQMARLVYGHTQEERARREVFRVAGLLEARVEAVPGARLIGPAPAFVARARGQYRWHLLLLAADVHPLLEGLALPAGWEVDVDPVSLLA